MVKSVEDYDIGEEAFHLRDAMNDILANLEALYLSHNVPLPTRRYWMVGDPAVDCEQAVVAFIQMYLGMPGDEAVTGQRCNGPLSMVVQLSISRPTKVMNKNGSAPSGESIQQDSEWAALDAYVLMDGLATLSPWALGPDVIATATVPEPQGGFITTQVQLTVVLP